MHPNETPLRDFFERLAAGDAAGAAGLYHLDVFRTDPLFPRLHGAQAAAFWRLAFGEVTGWRLQVHRIAADEDGGQAEWTARYVLGGRHVATRGRSLFAFADARIRRHYDHFSLWRWSAAVLGPAGALLGWFGPFRWGLRQSLARRLERDSAA